MIIEILTISEFVTVYQIMCKGAKSGSTYVQNVRNPGSSGGCFPVIAIIGDIKKRKPWKYTKG